MDSRELVDEIARRFDDSIGLLREDLKGVVSTQKDHEVRVVKLESAAGHIRAMLALTLSAIGSLMAYAAYKAIDLFQQK